MIDAQRQRVPFYMVWAPTGGTPVVQHATYEIAVGEAERLARLRPGQEFIVLKSMAARKMDNMERISYRGSPE